MAINFKRIFKLKTAVANKNTKVNVLSNINRVRENKIINDPKKIAKIKWAYTETKANLDYLRKISNPIKEKKLRLKILFEFEKRLKKQDFLMSFQKLAGSKKSAVEAFLDVLNEDYFNFVFKEYRKPEIRQPILKEVYELEKRKQNISQLRQEIDIYFHAANDFLQDKMSIEQFKEYSQKVQRPVKYQTTIFLKNRYKEYRSQIIEYIQKTQTMKSDIIPNALSNLDLKVQLLDYFV